MSTSIVRKARLTRLFGAALVVAGLVPVAVFAIGALVPVAEASAALGLFPAIPWLDARKFWWAPPASVVFALAGLAVILLGATLVRRQAEVFEAQRSRREDARRRTHLYGGPERIEPTLGPVD